MRPTLLNFRSTKEKTPLSYDAKNTYDGRLLSFKSPKGDGRRSSFSQERRFIAYDIIARRTGYRIGPGSYSPENFRDKIKCGSPYKDFHNQKQTDNNGYYMVGNTMLFEPGLILSSKKKLLQSNELKLDSSYISNRISKSAATTNNTAHFDAKNLDESINGKISTFYPKEKKTKMRVRKNMEKSLKIEDLLKKRFK